MREIYLDSGLTISRFGQTTIGTLINEKGLSFKNLTADFSENTAFEITDWKFQRTETRKSSLFGEETVLFASAAEDENSGENEILSFKEIFAGKKNFEKKAVESLSSVVTFAIKNGIVLPEVGFGGIYFVFDENSEIRKIIFLPAEVFSRCVSNYDKVDFTEFSGSSVRIGMKNEIDGEEFNPKAAAFLRAAAIYKFLTGTDAYSETDKNKRNLDMIDGKFLPLELAVFGVKSDFAEKINLALELSPVFKNVQSSRKQNFSAMKNGKKDFAEEKKAVFDFSMEELNLALKNFDENNENILFKNLSDEKKSAFLKEQENFLKRQKKIVGSARFLRRNSSRIFAALGAIVVAFYFISSFIKGNENLYTSIGATAEETVEMLYKGINDADVTIVQEVAKGKKIKDLETMVVGLRVKYRSHAAMTELGGNCTPEQWLLKKGETNYWMYGITNLEIDEKPVAFKEKYPTRKIHGQPLTSENGGGSKNEAKTVEVKYYLVHSDSDYRINVIKSSENVTVSWNGKKWLVTEVKGSAVTKIIETKKLKSDLKEALEKNSGDLKKAAAELKPKYGWLPEYF